MPLNANRRKHLLQLVPEGLLVTRHYLMENGLTVHALDNLVKSEQLEVLYSGVYVRPGTHLTWQGIVCSLQRIPQHAGLAVGGITALEMQGFGHYMLLGDKKSVHLYGADHLPVWVNKLLPHVMFVKHNANELRGRFLTHRDYDVKHDALAEAAYTMNEDRWPITVSSPERAFLEVLLDVPDKFSFEHADQLMQGLTALSPGRLQKLLETCQNIKVRRLFFWLAERYNYAWFKELKPVSFGSGKRQVAKNGKLDAKYQITVPENMWTETAPSSSKSSF